MSIALRTAPVVAGCCVAALAWPTGLPQDSVEAAWDLVRPAPVLAPGETARLDRLEELSCAECHAGIVEEWAETQHALAWVDPIYQEEMQDHRRPESCHGCHAPVPIHDEHLGKKPDVRPDSAEPGKARHFGVSCDACHLATDGAMLGPRGLDGGEAHASRISGTMTGEGSNRLCTTCHAINVGPVIGVAKDFAASDRAAQGLSCVGCHMAEVEREDGTKTRSHRLQTPRDPSFSRRAFELAVETRGAATVLSISNRTGHRVPGLIGRDYVFDAELLDAGGASLASGTLKLNTRTFLPVDQSVELALDGAGPRVVVKGRHYDPRLEEYVPFLDEELTVPGR